MYGVRKLAEANLVGLILTCVASVTGGEAGGGAKEHPRLATFARVCAMRDEPTVHDAADADLVCNMYAELSAAMQAYNASLPGSPAVLAEARLPTGEDGNALLCPAAACKSTVRSLFQHVHSLHLETFDEIVQLVDEMATERKGKSVVDVDLLVSRVLAKWHEGRHALRQQVGALFKAADVNGDGVLSYEEFATVVRLVQPSATEDRVWCAFRECVERTPSDTAWAPPRRPIPPAARPPRPPRLRRRRR